MNLLLLLPRWKLCEVVWQSVALCGGLMCWNGNAAKQQHTYVDCSV